MTRRVLSPWVLAFVLVAVGCSSSSPGPATTDAGPAACDADGVFLAAYGKTREQITTGQTAHLKVVLTRRGASQHEGQYVPGKQVQFTLAAGAPADFQLAQTSATSDGNGIAGVAVTAGTTPATSGVQVTASVGSCATTFTIIVSRPQRRLTLMGGSPRDGSVSSTVTLQVQASTNAGVALANETVTFALGVGASADMKLASTDGVTKGASVPAQTGTDGKATVRLETGTTPTTVTVTADMSGTAGVQVDVRVADKVTGSGCTGDYDCLGGQICANGVCSDPTAGSCTSNGQCTAPQTCVAGKCASGAGKPCRCAGTACAGCDDATEACIGGHCAPKPGACTSNDQCPTGFECQSGACVAVVNPCSTTNPCPNGQTCQAGQCQPNPDTCTISPRPTNRLQGTWDFKSVLHLREAVNPILGALLAGAGYLQDIMNGHLPISGIPSFLTDAVAGYLKGLMNEYIPAWGLDLIRVLSGINDLLNDMKVSSTVQITNASPDLYRASEHWDLVSFQVDGHTVQTNPDDLPEIGTLVIEDYTVREVCGVFYADKHAVKNAVGGLIKWAVEAALTAVTCGFDLGCYTSIGDMLNDLVDCDSIGSSVNDLVQGLWDGAPDVTGAVTNGCKSGLTQLINLVNTTLQNIVVQLAMMNLSGQADITGANIPSALANGKWQGTLGGGNFNGEFTATKH
jgi:hypothetical protein